MQKKLSLLIISLFFTLQPVKAENLYTYGQKAYKSYNAGNYAQAIHYYKKITKLLPNDDRLYSNLALAYKRNKQYELSLKAIEKAIELNPKEINYQLIRADLYSELDNNEKALSIYNNLYKKHPENKRIKNNLAYYFDLHIKKHKMNDLNKAIQYATQAVDMFPDSVDFFVKLGLLYLESETYDKALDIYKKVLQLEPTNEIALNNYEYIIDIKNKAELQYALDNIRPGAKAPKKLYKLVKVKKGVNPQIRQRVYYLLDLIYSDPEGRILLDNVKKKKIKIYISPNGKSAHGAFATKKSSTYSVYGIPVTFSSDTISIEERFINNFFNKSLDVRTRINGIVVIIHEACHALRSALRKNKDNALEEEITSSIIGMNIAYKLFLNRTLSEQETYKNAKGYLVGALSDDHAKLRPYNNFNEFIELDLKIKIPHLHTFKDLSKLYKEVKHKVKYKHTDLEYGNTIFYSY